MDPLVSVVIPAYNRADLISETLNSVFSQTYKNFEVLVIDNGSTDNTSEVISTYGNFVRYIKIPINQKVAFARNIGIHYAKGKYIAFLDSDDLWMSNKLKKQMELFDSNPDLGLVYCDSIVFDHETGKDLRRYSQEYPVADSLLIRCFISSPTPVVRKGVFNEIGFFDESIPACEDWDMWLRIYARYPIDFVNEPLARYRLHKASLIKKLDVIVIYESLAAIIKRAVDFAPDFYTAYQKQAMAKLCFIIGKTLLLNARIKESKKFFLKATCHHTAIFKSLIFFSLTFLGNKVIQRIINIYRIFKHRVLGVY